MRAVSSGVTPCGEASSRRLPGSMPAGYVSHTGYQYDSISLVAGQRELAPPSKFLKLGGFNRSVFITEATGTTSALDFRIPLLAEEGWRDSRAKREPDRAKPQEKADAPGWREARDRQGEASIADRLKH